MAGTVTINGAVHETKLAPGDQAIYGPAQSDDADRARAAARSRRRPGRPPRPPGVGAARGDPPGTAAARRPPARDARARRGARLLALGRRRGLRAARRRGLDRGARRVGHTSAPRAPGLRGLPAATRSP